MRALLLVAVLSLAACASNGSMSPGQLAKGDIDRVVDAHHQAVFASLKVLADKLYRRNPREWRKAGLNSGDEAIARLFDPARAWHLPELGGRYGVEAVLAGLKEDYPGDRVAALIGGLGGMLNDAFDDKTEFYLFDDLDPQKLHNAARNLEIAAWKLANARAADGGPLLLSNEMQPWQNLSFEREFGKMIGNLDLLSAIIADKTNRSVVKVIQGMASAVFLPVAGVK
jgi:hypothetical protein